MKKLFWTLIGLSLLVAPPVMAKKRGGTVVGPVITTTFVKNFNPYTQGASTNVSPGFIYEPLLVYNFRQGDKIEYLLATGYSYSDDLMSITYNLRKGAKWSDGKPITADDAIFSLGLGQKHAGLDILGLFQGENPKVKSVEKVDDYAFKFNLSKVDTTLEWFIGGLFIVPKHVWSSVENPGMFKNENPVGSGPLTEVKRFKPQQVTVCRNPHYWGDLNIDCLTLRQFQSNDQIQASLLRGKIDWGSNFIPDIEKTYVAKDPKNNHFWYPAGSPVAIHLNTKKKPFDNLKVRQALSMAIDRPQVVELATYGYASVNPHITGLGNFFESWYNDEINKKYDYLNKYNPEAAKKLLDEAGYKDTDGDGYRETPEGEPISIEVMVVNGWTDWVQSVQMVADYWKEVGMKTKTRTVDWGVYAEGWQKQKFHAGILWGGTGVTPYRFYEPLLHSRGFGKGFEGNHGFNSPEIDALIDGYASTGDKAKQKKIIDQLQEILAKNLPVLPLFSNPTWYQYSTKRFDGWPTEKNPYINPNFYEAGERVIMIKNIYKK